MVGTKDQETITIAFRLLTNVPEGEYKLESTIPIFYGVGNTPLEEIFSQFNIFLKQAGYVRSNDYILPDSLTADEREELECHLLEYRRNQNITKKEEE